MNQKYNFGIFLVSMSSGSNSSEDRMCNTVNYRVC